jgi:dihydropteroate synthase
LIWAGRGFRFDLSQKVAVMGVVNVTPDSFYDGGRHAAPDAAIAHGLRLCAEGADALDVGGESTRPGAPPVSADDELARVLPVIEGLRRATAKPISVDTRKAAVAREALRAGANIVNDVSALADPEMGAVVAAADAGLALMHMQGEPTTMQDDPRYDDLLGEIEAFLRERLARARAAGVAAERIVLDPGVGFGKTAAHNLTLFKRLGRLAALPRPILIGPSRKRFIGAVTGAAPDDRLPGTLAALALAVAAGARVVRVHDVGAAVQAAAVADAIARADG